MDARRQGPRLQLWTLRLMPDENYCPICGKWFPVASVAADHCRKPAAQTSTTVVSTR